MLCVSSFKGFHAEDDEKSRKESWHFHLEDVRQRISDRTHLQDHDIDILMSPGENLLDDETIWNQPYLGLASFLSADHSEIVALDYSPGGFIHISDHYITSPLLKRTGHLSEDVNEPIDLILSVQENKFGRPQGIVMLNKGISNGEISTLYARKDVFKRGMAYIEDIDDVLNKQCDHGGEVKFLSNGQWPLQEGVVFASVD